MDNKVGNVLVIGNSGVGKSTLINAVLGDEVAKTGWGTGGVTTRLEIYENNALPFRVIDSIGFEPSLIKETLAVNAVKKWSRETAKQGGGEKEINVIWYCVEGTSSKLFSKSIHALTRATRMWKNVPVIVVITKSYSKPERRINIDMVRKAFAGQKRYSGNLKDVIPVVAAPYRIDDTVFVEPDGIVELIEATNALMPEGVRAARIDIANYSLTRKRSLAHGVVAAAVTGSTVIGAVPIPFADALLLAPLETGMIRSIGKLYGIKKDDAALLFNTMIEVGTVSVVAKGVISAVKAIPAVNLGASVINAVTAGVIVFMLGEGSIHVFEQIYLGNKTVSDIEWVRKIIETKLASEAGDIAGAVLKNIKKGAGLSAAAGVIAEIAKKKAAKNK